MQVHSFLSTPLAAGLVLATPAGGLAAQFPPGPADDLTTSLGSFRIVVAPAFQPMMVG